MLRAAKALAEKRRITCTWVGCSKEFCSKANMLRHVSSAHLKTREHKCGSCSKTFARRDLRDIHEETHSDAKRFVCSYEGCTKAYKQAGSLYTHEQVHGEKRWKCDLEDCEFSTFQKSTLEKHLRSSLHLNIRPFACLDEECDARFGSKYGRDLHHMTVHLHVHPHQCGDCDVSCATKTYLARHIREVHGDIRDNVCGTCGMAFKRAAHLKTHVDAVHLKIHPFQCDICGFTSAHGCNLVDHTRRHHTGEKPYECAYCESTFASSGNLRDHEGTHFGIKSGRICKADECDVTATYGDPGGKAVRCKGHATCDMINVAARRCATDGCEIIPCFERPDDPGFRYCAEHAGVDRVNVKGFKCPHGGKLALCKGAVCRLKMGKHSQVEIFVTSVAFIILGGSPDDIDGFTESMTYRHWYDAANGKRTRIEPDLVMADSEGERWVVEYDGRYAHESVAERDAMKTAELVKAGFTVLRIRDRLPEIAVDGCVNVPVSGSWKFEFIGKTVAAAMGGFETEAEWSALWRQANSLAERTILQFHNDRATQKQDVITNHFAPAAAAAAAST